MAMYVPRFSPTSIKTVKYFCPWSVSGHSPGCQARRTLCQRAVLCLYSLRGQRELSGRASSLQQDNLGWIPRTYAGENDPQECPLTSVGSVVWAHTPYMSYITHIHNNNKIFKFKKKEMG